MKKQPTFLFYFLGVYVVLQFSWWAYHIIQLTQEVGYEKAAVNKRIGMIIGEGLVFFIILVFGLWRIIRSIKKEHDLARRQHNFLLSVTHELKTPLASTKLYLQTLLKRNFDSEKREELLHKALTENKRLEEIVETILISARIENRTFEIHREQFNLNAEIEKIITHFHTKYNQNFIVLKSNQLVDFNSDLFMIRTILINLLENAVKYAGITHEIEIEVIKKENSLQILVKDSGPGIPKEHQQQVFQKFVRLENEETRSTKGTGLGLFIVKEFTNLCGGTIVYRDNPGNGAIFELKFEV